MQLIKSYFFAIILLTISISVHASEAADLSAALNNVTSMQAEFTQTIFDNKGKAIQQSFGKMALERPGKFRWEVAKPIPQLVVANGSKLWIYDPDLEQVTIRSLKHVAGETPALLLSHNNTLIEKDFVVKAIAHPKRPGQWFELTERKKDSTFESIQMAFVNKQISEMRLRDHLGHTTQIEFKIAKINTPLSQALFVFKAPKQVDVIDETKKK